MTIHDDNQDDLQHILVVNPVPSSPFINLSAFSAEIGNVVNIGVSKCHFGNLGTEPGCPNRGSLHTLQGHRLPSPGAPTEPHCTGASGGSTGPPVDRMVHLAAGWDGAEDEEAAVVSSDSGDRSK